MLHVSSNRSVFLAVPAYAGVSAGTAFSLFESARSVDAELAVLSGCCHVDDARNYLVKHFLETRCQDLVFIDSDMRWRPDQLERLLSYDADVVGASYLRKQESVDYAVRLLPGAQQANAQGLLEVEGLPTGFLRIKRHVLERLAEQSPHMDKTPVIFERELHDGVRWGGDYVFCRKWRAMGGSVYCDPEIALEHSGERVWCGSLGQLMRRNNGLPMPELDNPTTAADFSSLYDAWGNEYAAMPAVLMAAAMLAKESTGPILEFGSGLSTLVMARANPAANIHALEHDPQWIDRMENEIEKYGIANVTLHYAPIINRFYDWSTVPVNDYRLVVLDGPPRAIADRNLAFSLHAPNATWLMDDAESLNLRDKPCDIADVGQRQIAIHRPMKAAA